MAPSDSVKKPVASQRLELLRSASMNKWVALSADETRIVAIGNTFLEADEAAKKTGEAGYFLTKTPDSWLRNLFAPGLKPRLLSILTRP